MLMAQGTHSSFKPSLLTKTEIDWLSGKLTCPELMNIRQRA
jgi:hypothetical protein